MACKRPLVETNESSATNLTLSLEWATLRATSYRVDPTSACTGGASDPGPVLSKSNDLTYSWDRDKLWINNA